MLANTYTHNILYAALTYIHTNKAILVDLCTDVLAQDNI